MEDRKFSGERFMPEMNDAELEIEHLARYYAVQNLVKELDILDAACGEGYGSNILASVAKSVVGIDIDSETVQNANSKYASSRENLQYLQGSIADLSFIESGSKDAIVSFETIEHVDKDLQQAFLKEIKRILKPTGFLVMSTPDKKEYSDRYSFNNEFHVAEFYVDEFIDYLKQEFVNVELYNQYLEVASFIDRPNVDREDVLFVKDSNKYQPVGKYVIAVASNQSMPQQSMSAVFMHHKETYLPTLDELNYCRHEAIVCRERAMKLDECLNENKLQAEELERRAVELENRMGVINELRQENMRLASEKEEYVNQFKNAEIELENCAVELENRMSVINELRQENMRISSEKDEVEGGLQNAKIELERCQEEFNRLKSLSIRKLIKWFWDNKRK